MRWTLRDGLVGLIDLARWHLIREIVWRVEQEWPGAEVHLDDAPGPAGDERKVVSPARKAKNDLRAKRRRCWCGQGRYKQCHGAIPAQDELELLSLA
jgi:hypothetical protein